MRTKQRAYRLASRISSYRSRAPWTLSPSCHLLLLRHHLLSSWREQLALSFLSLFPPHFPPAPQKTCKSQYRQSASMRTSLLDSSELDSSSEDVSSLSSS